LSFKKIIYGAFSLLFVAQTVYSQTENQYSLFEPADTFHRQRVNLAIGTAAVTYTGFSIALYNTWYKQFPREGFHFFDDWGEWNNMDKAGHIYSAYFQSAFCYKTTKWAGISEERSILTGALCAALFQSTIEVMDGFSSQWGFSLTDFGANLMGIGSFVTQQKTWGEQRILFKVSSTPNQYSIDPIFSTNGMESTSFRQRADQLFGSGYSEAFLKDYNAQTVWISANLKSFLPNSKIPTWLNLAFGYGSENMFGGFENQWVSDAGNAFVLNQERYKQFYLSPDIDLTKIKTKSPFLKTVLYVLNIFKIPLPTLEYNSLGELKWKWLFF